jgi:hypothetical protein
MKIQTNLKILKIIKAKVKVNVQESQLFLI